MYTSATSIFSAGTSFRWVRDNLCRDLVEEALQRRVEDYEVMTSVAAEAPAGSHRLLFNPSLGGGTALDASPNIRGAFVGLDLKHTKADIVRATMEGIVMGLQIALDALRELTRIGDEILVVGGGSRSRLWRQICADVFDLRIVKTNIDQNAAALGAAAVASVGIGLWEDFTKVDTIHRVVDQTEPIPENREIYRELLPIFRRVAEQQAEIGDMMQNIQKRGGGS
jgi:xylulokinase